MKRIALVCFALAAALAACPALAQQQPQEEPTGPVPLPKLPAVPQLPELPQLPGGVQGNGWQGSPVYRATYDYAQWQLRNPYWYYYPSYYWNSPYAYGQNGSSPYSPYGSPQGGNNIYAPNGSVANPYMPANQPQANAPRANAPKEDSRATIRVMLPSTAADVWVDGHKMPDTLNDQRVFSSPPLEGGHNYQYTVKARWLRRGENVMEERLIDVAPNRQVTVDFTRPSGK